MIGASLSARILEIILRLKYDFRPCNLDQFLFSSLEKKIEKHPYNFFLFEKGP